LRRHAGRLATDLLDAIAKDGGVVGAHSTALLETLPPKKRGSARRHLDGMRRGLLAAHRITRLATELRDAIAKDGGVEGTLSAALLASMTFEERVSVRRQLAGLLAAHHITRLATELRDAIAKDGGVEGTLSAALLASMTFEERGSVRRQLAGWSRVCVRVRQKMLEGSPLQMENSDLVETEAFQVICSELGTYEGVKATSIEGHQTSTAGTEFSAELLAGAWVVRLDIAISGKKNPTRRHAFVCRKCGFTFMVRGFGR
jgi:hypothetical protein